MSPERRVIRRLRSGPGVLILSGWALGLVGLVVLCVSTIQTQQTFAGGLLNQGPMTLTFTGPVLLWETAVFLSFVMALPLVLLFVPSRFYLLAVIAPFVVALSMSTLILQVQLPSGAVISSETSAFVGDAFVFLGCGFEIAGIVRERNRRTVVQSHPSRAPATASPRTHSPPR